VKEVKVDASVAAQLEWGYLAREGLSREETFQVQPEA
jgi:hypothetical protein